MKLTFLFALLFFSSARLFCAEYNGVDLDGETYSCSAYSYETSNYYNVAVEFSGTDVIVIFANGGTRILTLDDEEIDDPHNISAYDYDEGVYWDLDVDGID